MLKLADLARVRISPEEAANLSHEFEGILNYVGEVKAVTTISSAKTPDDFPVRNVLRADGEGHESGMHTEKLLAASPEREGNYFKVKKIL